MSDIIIQNYGAVGRITLNRPKALNALTHDMINEISKALDVWEDDVSVSCVVIEGTGDRAFCAGGDIQTIYENGRSNPDMIRQFWREEYELNYRISQYPKPFIAFMDGFVMGGGVGVSAHGSHRFVTERSVVSMPEVSIGFLPDVGGTWLFSRSPGKVGLYCGMTAARMNSADAIYAGFADYYIASEDIEDLIEALRDGGGIDDLVSGLKGNFDDASALESNRAEIDALFSGESLNECVHNLEKSDTEFASATLKALSRNAPFAVSCAFYAINNARDLDSLSDCLKQEYRYVYRCLEGEDFFEGIRAAVIDKDRNPKWKPERFEDVSDAAVKASFESLEAQELKL